MRIRCVDNHRPARPHAYDGGALDCALFTKFLDEPREELLGHITDDDGVRILYYQLLIVAEHMRGGAPIGKRGLLLETDATILHHGQVRLETEIALEMKVDDLNRKLLEIGELPSPAAFIYDGVDGLE